MTLRLAMSCGVIVAILAACLNLPNVDHATVGLLMVAAILGIGSLWGGAEALTGALVGGIGFDYYFLPPRGFGIANPEHIVALVAFLLIAITIGQLSARSKRLMRQNDSLLRLSLDPLCIHDLNGRFRNANQAMVDLLGWPEQELRTRPILEFVHPDDRDRTKAAYHELSANRSVVNFENRCRAKDGGWRWLHWRIAPQPSGEPHVSAAARDITQEKLDREKLRHLAGELMTAQEEERRRIARDLHDDFTQRLATFGIELGLLKRTNTGMEALDRLQTGILKLSEDLRLLSHSLHPSILEHADLTATLEMHCREFTKSHGIAAGFSARDVPDEIPRPVTVTLYRIAQEALRNVAQHSGADAVSVILAGEDGSQLSLFIIDNGKGFDAEKVRASPGLGLLSIEERARTIGALVTMDSMPGAGATLCVRVPLMTPKLNANEA
jgi:PAS domain S-box-containing protein